MRRFLLAAVVLFVSGTLFFCFADEGSGILGRVIIDFMAGLLSDPIATAAYGFLSLVIVRVIQFGLARLPTRRQKIVGRLVWRLAEILFGVEVALENDADAENVPSERERLRAQLKKRFPILDVKLKGD